MIIQVDVAPTLTFGSLFSGFGGMDLGLERAGLQCRWQVENNKYARRVLEKHWPTVRRHDDVRTFPPSDGTNWGVDLIAGGDPCQENSAARATGTKCTQPSLGAEFVAIIESLRPRFVLRENPTRVRADAPWPWFRFRNCLHNLGYVVLPFRLRACCFGADHQRDRLFLLAERADAGGVGLARLAQKSGQWQDKEWIRDKSARLRWRRATPRICRRADGISNRVERLRGLGNAVVPQVAEWIGRQLLEAIA